MNDSLAKFEHDPHNDVVRHFQISVPQPLEKPHLVCQPRLIIGYVGGVISKG